MNINETLVQQMVLRDIEYGTNHHRYGYKESLRYIKHLEDIPVSKDKTFDLIAQKLRSAALTYDDLLLNFIRIMNIEVKYFLKSGIAIN